MKGWRRSSRTSWVSTPISRWRWSFGASAWIGSRFSGGTARVWSWPTSALSRGVLPAREPTTAELVSEAMEQSVRNGQPHELPILKDGRPELLDEARRFVRLGAIVGRSLSFVSDIDGLLNKRPSFVSHESRVNFVVQTGLFFVPVFSLLPEDRL